MYLRGAGIFRYGMTEYFPSLNRISWSIICMAGSRTIRYSFSSSKEECFEYDAIRSTSPARSLTINSRLLASSALQYSFHSLTKVSMISRAFFVSLYTHRTNRAAIEYLDRSRKIAFALKITQYPLLFGQ